MRAPRAKCWLAAPPQSKVLARCAPRILPGARATQPRARPATSVAARTGAGSPSWALQVQPGVREPSPERLSSRLDPPVGFARLLALLRRHGQAAKATDCKSVITGSSPVAASTLHFGALPDCGSTRTPTAARGWRPRWILAGRNLRVKWDGQRRWHPRRRHWGATDLPTKGAPATRVALRRPKRRG